MWLKKVITKDKFLVALGATGFLHELLIIETERPFILTASLALMGLPIVMKAEEKLRKNGKILKNGQE